MNKRAPRVQVFKCGHEKIYPKSVSPEFRRRFSETYARIDCSECRDAAFRAQQATR